MMGGHAMHEAAAVAAARYPQPRFANCRTCGKLTLQTDNRGCEEAGQCHGMVVELFDIADTERGALAFRSPR
jgi:hypothetical protein